MRLRWKTLLGLTLLIAGLVSCVWGASLILQADQYVATARVWAEPDVTLLDRFTDPAERSLYSCAGWDDLLALFRSPAFLSNVVTRLDPNIGFGNRRAGGQAPTTPEIINAINENMAVVPIRGGSLIALEVRSGHPDEAAATANTVAEAFRDYRVAKCREPAETRLRAMQARHEEEAKLIPLLSSNVNRLRLEFHIHEGDPDPLLVPVSVPPSQLGLGSPAQMAALLEVRRAYQQEAFVFTNLQKLTREARRDSAYGYYQGYEPFEWEPRDRLSKRLHRAEREYVDLTNSHGTASFKCRRLCQLIEKLRRQMDEDIDGIMRRRARLVASMKTTLDSLTATVQAAQNGRDTFPYWEKWHELEERSRLQTLRVEKIAAAQTILQTPITSMVAAYAAEGANTPASPDRPLGVTLLFTGIVLLARCGWLAWRKTN